MEWHRNSAEDFSINVFSVTPCQPRSPETLVSDYDKAGATLLLSGVFLGLVGITFMVMGWARYEGVTQFEWTQLLGPILLSVGVTFLLIAVCKFKMLTCKSCNQSEERASDIDQIPRGQSFVFTGISQPITFHGATVVQYIPSYPAHENVNINSASFHQVLSHTGLLPLSGPTVPASSPPHYYNAYPLDNPAFSIDEYSSSYLVANTRSERSTNSQEKPDAILDEDACSDFLPPPYEKLFPFSS